MKTLKIFYLAMLVLVLLVAIQYHEQYEILIGCTILFLICIVGAKYSHELIKIK